MRIVNENLCNNEISIVIGKGALSALEELKDKKVALFYSQKIDPSRVKSHLKSFIEIPIIDGEDAKDIQYALKLVKFLFENGFDRGDYVIALGGGTVTDVVGFVASIYMRGINLINIPTTLLGMVDAAIGGKTGVNFENVKNVLGTFYQPIMIISDLNFLETLPLEEIKKGLAEVIKYGLVLDKDLYDYLAMNKEKIFAKDESALEEIIYKSSVDKFSVVKADERETKGIRIVLNFGHTIGHAIEAGSNFTVPHGYAISVGMVCEAKMAEEVGYAEEGVVEDVTWILSQYELPLTVDSLNAKIDVKKAIDAITKDKKVRGGYVMMPFPTRIGDWKRVDVPIETLKGFAEQCLR
ncbi:3-dehydroquinate synthase [Sulfurisphaera ohwakuensis]|uniref:3-dehydroquinate synthase n=1 Tax=Sulfurisphaera ohwakuensis TaxID=69656 RepID=A0A650CJF4_SULOH|nr:3-dehydroquinate synthase [Sulfurisphaera ohwakuensis]MBB5254023.1 3-dehydroquinate synthase [Sulfurisphaera ohwakuensis]QGR17903.1 3-dehydroquinate synthase [Sulfurisphaera ohwakuensis]